MIFAVLERLNPAYGQLNQDATTDIDAKYVKRRGTEQGCAFSGSQNQNLTVRLPFPQDRHFWAQFRRYLEIFARKML